MRFLTEKIESNPIPKQLCFSHCFCSLCQIHIPLYNTMATNLLTFQPSAIRACATNTSTTNNRRTVESDRLKPTASSAKWWGPLFGVPSDADYIDGNNPSVSNNDRKIAAATEEMKAVDGNRSRFNPGCFTEEKAKQFRLMTKENESFHDAMYHSAIASRLALASDISERRISE